MNNSYLNGYMIGYLEKEAAPLAPLGPPSSKSELNDASNNANDLIKHSGPPEPKIDQAAAKKAVNAQNPPAKQPAPLMSGLQANMDYILKQRKLKGQ